MNSKVPKKPLQTPITGPWLLGLTMGPRLPSLDSLGGKLDSRVHWGRIKMNSLHLTAQLT